MPALNQPTVKMYLQSAKLQEADRKRLLKAMRDAGDSQDKLRAVYREAQSLEKGQNGGGLPYRTKQGRVKDTALTVGRVAGKS